MAFHAIIVHYHQQYKRERESERGAIIHYHHQHPRKREGPPRPIPLPFTVYPALAHRLSESTRTALVFFVCVFPTDTGHTRVAGRLFVSSKETRPRATRCDKDGGENGKDNSYVTV